MSNGVRNLRAMFETSAASSPEPRGRSPVDYIAAGDNSEERPKSKVRASFVPVEPPTSHPSTTSTDLGTTKGTPTNSIAAHRRESFRVSEDQVDELAELKKVVSEEKEERRKSVAVAETVPEEAVASRESSIPAPPIREEPAEDMPNLGSIMRGSDFPEPSPGVEENESSIADPPAEVEKAEVVEAPAQTEESPVEVAKVAEPSSIPSPEAAAAQSADQPAENPDKPVTGAQEDVSLRPAAPADETEAAVADEPAVSEEAAVAEEAAAVADAASPDDAVIPSEALPSPAAPAEPADNPDKAVTGAQEEVSLQPAAPTDETAISEDQAPAEAETAESSVSVVKTPEPTEPTEPKAAANGTPAKKPETKKPAAISTTKPSKALSASARSPPLKPAPKTPTTPKSKASATAAKPSPTKAAPKPAAHPKPVAHKPAASKEPVKAPVAKAPTTKTSRTSLRPAASSSSATAPTAGAASKAKAPAPHTDNKKPAAPKPATTKPAAPASRTSVSPVGFKKPPPRSPTRPVGLPSRLTAPTAASAAKHGEEAKVTRKPSTTARPPSKAATARPSRPSVAPTTAPKRPESRTSTASSAPKGGFLERMMRPTAASASKTHEKPTSPPRKTAGAAKPSTLQKGKKKVEEIASKAKAVATNGHHDDEHKTEDEHKAEDEHKVEDEQKPDDGHNAEDEAMKVSEPAAVEETSHEPTKTATPVQDVESSTAELQTPNFQGEELR